MLSLIVGAFCFAFGSLPAFAQCAMCRASFGGSSGAAMAKSLNQGIIVLLIPPVAIFCAIFIAAIKYRKSETSSKDIT
ncbi:MAG: hypothetical protein ICV68_02860 [Pyrinomonadaceae bacterium]|nr:hypothetical protein [Pyrinomonadaceae bacterium]